jgi:hypothetical protein
VVEGDFPPIHRVAWSPSNISPGLLGLSSVWLEKSHPSPLFPIYMKPLSTNLLSPVLPHFLSQPENLYNRYNRSTLKEV